MIVVFSKAAGQVSAFQDPTLPARTSLLIEDWGGFLGFKSIISRVTVAARGNYQFLHTLGGQVFIYVFGDRIGQLTLAGLSFDSTCEDEAGTLGIERVLEYYSSHRVSARETPIRVTIGTATTLAGYLLGITGDVVDPKSRIWQFNMELGLIPEENDDDAISPTADEPAEEDESGTSTISSPGTFPPLELSGSPDRGGVMLTTSLDADLEEAGYADPATGPRIDLVRALQL